jgi:hypothetical protein
MVFTSGDNLHRRTVPLFLRPDQSFVKASELKAALGELDIYYDHFSAEVKALGVMAFAHAPPPHLDNLVVQLWDKHMRRDWRERVENPDEILARRRATEEEGKESAAEFRDRVEAAVPVGEGEREALRETGEPDYVLIKRQVRVEKGKWRLLPEGIEKTEEKDSFA